MNKTLNVALALVLALSLVPAAAFADSGTEAEYDRGTGQKANSWRYTDGVLDDPVPAETVTDEGGIAPFAAWSDVPTEDRAVANTWTRANTKDNYTLRFKPTDKDRVISVPGSLAVGIDVSEHNNAPGGRPAGSIDWNQVKADGVTFAIIRCGYGSDYKSQDDDWFVDNYKGARAAGLDVGIYLYSYAPKATGAAPSAASEAAHVLRLLKDNGIAPEDLAYPVYLDLEDSSQANLKKGTLGAIATTFCNTLSAAGYRVGIYANQYWFESVLKNDHAVFSPESMAANGWSRWVARYSNGTSSSEVQNTDIWQFTSIGKIAGTPRTYCDTNFTYKPAAAGATPSRPATTTPAPAPAPAPAPQHTIKYVLNKGKNAKGNPATYAGTVALKNPTRSGYTFQGWYADKKFKKRVTKLTNQNATVYAKWAKNYKITYKLNGGKNHKANPKKYGGTLTLKNPSRSGYTFKGWYSNKKLTKKVTKLSMTKNRTVYAKWAKLKPGTYRVNTPGGLFIRSTPSTSGAVKGGLANGQRVRIVKIKGDWGRLSDGRGWIKLSYTKRA